MRDGTPISSGLLTGSMRKVEPRNTLKAEASLTTVPRAGPMFRTGDTIALSSAPIITEDQIGEIFEKVGKVIRQLN